MNPTVFSSNLNAARRVESQSVGGKSSCVFSHEKQEDGGLSTDYQKENAHPAGRLT